MGNFGIFGVFDRVFLFLFFGSVNDFSTTRRPIHANVCMRVFWFRMFRILGVSSPRRTEKGEMAVFERYLSNAWTDPHKILFV